MSQITRCPSCGTSFKVVADQLRISEGWVRCGQCKHVFDAAAHLVVIEPAQLLPDMRFGALRTTPGGADGVAPLPPTPPVRVWGSARPQPPVSSADTLPAADSLQGSAQGLGVAAGLADAGVAEPAGGDGVPVSAEPPSPAAGLPSPAAGLPSPAPHASAAPSAQQAARTGGAENWTLQPRTLHGWSARPPVVPPAGVAVHPSPQIPSAGEPPASVAPSSPEPALAPSGGYELPFAQLRDSEWPEDLELETTPSAEIERPLPILSEVPGVRTSRGDSGPVPALLIAPSVDSLPAAHAQEDAALTPSQALAPGVHGEPSREALPRRGAPLGAGLPSEGSDDDGQVADRVGEPDFMRSARRQAFWRSSPMRAILAGCALLLGGLLMVQVALHERDVLAARYPGLRGALEVLCTPWQCRLAAPRRISDVMIDSSSFTRGRADAYLLTMTLKNNNAAMAIAMPAVELTLTDAQEQPLLRRVLQSAEMAAPQELAARGEWSGTLTLNVAEHGSRVAGYRLLAFYP